MTPQEERRRARPERLLLSLGSVGSGGSVALCYDEHVERRGGGGGRKWAKMEGNDQSPEFKFRFVFFGLQMLRFSALCGPNEQKFGEHFT